MTRAELADELTADAVVFEQTALTADPGDATWWRKRAAHARAAATALAGDQDGIGIEAGHPEARCERCGGPNCVWFAPSVLWNAVVRESDQRDPMLCPLCFIAAAEAKGHRGPWEVREEGRVLADDRERLAEALGNHWLQRSCLGCSCGERYHGRYDDEALVTWHLHHVADAVLAAMEASRA